VIKVISALITNHFKKSHLFWLPHFSYHRWWAEHFSLLDTRWSLSLKKGDSDDRFLLVINTDNFMFNSGKVSPARPQPGQPKPLRDLESSYQSHRRTFKSPKNQFTVSRSPHFVSFSFRFQLKTWTATFSTLEARQESWPSALQQRPRSTLQRGLRRRNR
jgi:hypothetical protein